MAVLSWTTEVTGFEGIVPKLLYIETNDTFATITTAGYLNPSVEAGMEFTNHAMALVLTSTGVVWLQTSVINGVHSLISPSTPSPVILPTIVDHIATYADTTGTLTEDPATAYTNGNISANGDLSAGGDVVAGLSAGSGVLKAWSTNFGGFMQIYSAAGFTHQLSITHALTTGSRLYTIPDPGNILNSFFAVTTAPTVANNFIMASGVDGQIVDSGVPVAGLQLNASGTISAANFQGMYATPVQLIPAPGAGFGIVVFSAYLELVFATAAPAGGGAIIFQYGNTVHGAGVNTIKNGGTLTVAATFATTAAVNQWTTLENGANIGTTASSTTTNLGVFLSNATGAFTANGGTSSITYAINYMIVPMP